MAPLKFEEEIKEKIEGRSIAPSDETWERLAGQLPSKERRKKKGWWYIAAACVVGLGVFVFFQEGQDAVNEVKIVDRDTETEVLEVKNGKSRSNFIVDKEEAVVENQKQAEVIEEIKRSQVKKKKKNTQEVAAITKKDSKNTPEIMITEEKQVLIHTNTKSKTVEESVAEVVAMAKLLQQQNSQVTNAEIDSLLKEAEKTLALNKMIRASQAVTAESLLKDVENELEQSFREKVFDALKENYIKVKTAVADRNN